MFSVAVSFAGGDEAPLESIQQFILAIGLAVLVIYMVLAAQFESLLHPSRSCWRCRSRWWGRWGRSSSRE